MVSITWNSNQSASVLYAAARTTRWQGYSEINPSFSGMSAAAQSLDNALHESKEDANQLWQNLLSIAVTSNSPLDIADQAIALGCFSHLDHKKLLTALTQCTLAFHDCCPRFEEEMQYRQLPLRNLWEAEGPGLLHSIVERIGGTLPGFVSVCLTQPISPGGGFANSNRSEIFAEAVLTHEDPRLPETLRLGWLLAQCSKSESLPITPNREVDTHALALVPLTLSMGEQVGATTLNADVIQAALKNWAGGPHWRPHNFKHAEHMAEALHAWWSDVAASEADWDASILKLADLLEKPDLRST